MAIIFTNPGLLELKALSVFGWSVKICDNPHGQFGSGSRYSLAGLLRLKHRITLFRGLDRYTFGTTKVEARGGIKMFDVVTMTGPDGFATELPFTLELGKGWTGCWQLYRELHTNALDEGGTTTSTPVTADTYQPRPNETAILVEGAEIEAAHRERHTIFLQGEPRHKAESVAIHLGASKYGFYRGVRIIELQHASLYTYNLTVDTELTEDRTLKHAHDLDRAVARAIAQSEDEVYLRDVLVAPSGVYEHHLSEWWSSKPTDTFMRVYTELVCSGDKIMMTGIANAIYAEVRKTPPMPKPLKMTVIQEKQLAKAREFCAKAGWTEVEDYPIVIVPRAKGGLLAYAEPTTSTIVLTLGCFEEGVKTLVHALLEEATHLKHGFRDGERNFQSYLFRRWIGATEQLTGEPL